MDFIWLTVSSQNKVWFVGQYISLFSICTTVYFYPTTATALSMSVLMRKLLQTPGLLLVLRIIKHLKVKAMANTSASSKLGFWALTFIFSTGLISELWEDPPSRIFDLLSFKTYWFILDVCFRSLSLQAAAPSSLCNITFLYTENGTWQTMKNNNNWPSLLHGKCTFFTSILPSSC